MPVKALTKELIQEIVEAYGTVAGLAKRAGFEMLMIHGGHGWLLNQFLSPYFNKRTDEYGGSLENRCRLAIEVLKSVRAAVGPGFPIEFRMSGSELFEGGYDLEEGCRIAEMLEPYIDLLHVSAGTYQRGFGNTHPSMFKEHGCNVYLAAEIKKHVKVPVATLGGLNDPAQMEQIIAEGKADVIYMARALLADPFLPRKVMANKDDEIVRCLRCFTCMAERAATSTRRCTVNPLIGRELEGDEIGKAPVPRKVVVVGGGPGGLKAAETAALRGHQVILMEKEGELGGILKSEQAIPFKYEMYQLSRTFADQCRRAGVEIRLNTEATKEAGEKENPDALIIAAGSQPLVPPIEGIHGDNVVIVNQYYLEKDKVQDEVVVLGGGLAVLVLACFFFQHSKATPVQPVEPVSSASEIPASSAEVSAESTQPQAVDSVSASDGLTFSLSAEMVHDKLSLKLDYGTVLFVVDPNASDITLQFDGFRTRYLTHSSEKAGTTEFSYHIPKYNALPDSDSALLTITVPENILHEVDIDLAMGDVDLGTLSLDELDLELAMGSVSADSLTVKDADFDLAMGGCHIDHLSAPEFDAELAMGDCTIGMLSGAQDVNISVTLGKAALTLEGSASDYTLVTNGLMGTSIQDGKANPSRKISLSTTTGDLSISYTN